MCVCACGTDDLTNVDLMLESETRRFVSGSYVHGSDALSYVRENGALSKRRMKAFAETIPPVIPCSCRKALLIVVS